MFFFWKWKKYLLTHIWMKINTLYYLYVSYANHLIVLNKIKLTTSTNKKHDKPAIITTDDLSFLLFSNDSFYFSFIFFAVFLVQISVLHISRVFKYMFLIDGAEILQPRLVSLFNLLWIVRIVRILSSQQRTLCIRVYIISERTKENREKERTKKLWWIEFRKLEFKQQKMKNNARSSRKIYRKFLTIEFPCSNINFLRLIFLASVLNFQHSGCDESTNDFQKISKFFSFSLFHYFPYSLKHKTWIST